MHFHEEQDHKTIIGQIVAIMLANRSMMLRAGIRQCFWCEKYLSKSMKTKDHVIPRYLGGKRTVICCEPCNKERSHLSNLSKDIRKIKKVWKIEKKLGLIKKYTKLIKDKLSGREHDVCLEELARIMTWGKKVACEPVPKVVSTTRMVNLAWSVGD